jgi:hypothetical protein
MKLKWYIGLTRDFRHWKILSTTGKPDYAFGNEYIWFYGPFPNKQAAEDFKAAEKLNPRRRK